MNESHPTAGNQEEEEEPEEEDTSERPRKKDVGLMERLKSVDCLGFVYAVLVGSGGVYGFTKTGSIPSIAAGLVFGSAIAIGAYRVSKGSGHGVALGSAASLGGLMALRYFQSGKFMPAGLLAAISIGMTVRYSVMALTANQTANKDVKA